MRSFALAVLLATSPQGVTAPMEPVVSLGEVGLAIPGVKFDGSGVNDTTGHIVNGVGDVNADGREDFAITSPLDDPFRRNAAGTVYLIYGTPSLASIEQFEVETLGMGQGVVFHGRQAGDQISLNGIAGLGDINGDGISDFGFSCRLDAKPGFINSGTAYIVFGRSGGVSDQLVFDLNSLNGANGFIVEGTFSHEDLGSRIAAAGDVNADGIDDFLLGAGQAQTVAPGHSYLIYGSPSIGAGGTLDVSALDGPTGVRINGVQSGDRAFCVAGLRDINADGIDDFLIGLWGADRAGLTDVGEAVVLYGSRSPLGTAGVFNLADLTSAEGVLIRGVDEGAMTGFRASAAGDVNGDGTGDFILTAPFSAVNGLPDSGVVYLIYGSAAGIGTGATLDLAEFGPADGLRIDGAGEGDLAGYQARAAGDINGDGFADFLVGAAAADVSAEVDAGETYLILGSEALLGQGGILSLAGLNGTNGFRFQGEGANDQSGREPCGVGDVDGDGFQDFMTTAYLADPGGIVDAGRAYLIFGSSFRAETSYASFLPGFSAPISDLGIVGTDFSSIPPSRCEVGFTGGEGPGNAGASLQRVVFTDPDFGLQNFGPRETIADIVWYVTTDRADWVSGEVVFHYLDREIPGLDESRLCLYTAPGPFGPWVHVPGAAFDAIRNRVAAPVTRLGLFLIAQAPRASDADSASVLEVLLGQRPEHPVFDLNGDRKINVADLLEGL